MKRINLRFAILLGCLAAVLTLLITSHHSITNQGELTMEELQVQLASAVGKIPPQGNPLVSHKFGADPYALVYDGRVYLYTTNDVLEYGEDGSVKDNTYGNINKIGDHFLRRSSELDGSWRYKCCGS